MRAHEETIDMAAAIRELNTHLTPVSSEPDPKEIVAVVLSDGSVRDLRGGPAAVPARRMTMGSVSGPEWVLWWTRRSFADA